MKSLIAICLASVYGLCIRWLFVSTNGLMFIMSSSFILFLPAIIGYLTVILMPYKHVNTKLSAFFMPWATCLVVLVVTLLFDIEGSVCWIMIFPIFALLASMGGLIAYSNRKKREEPTRNNDRNNDILDDPNTLKVSVIVLLPLFLGIMEGERLHTRLDFDVSETLTVAAAPSKVWSSLLNIKPIAHHEASGFSTLLGFPRHLETTLDTLKIGGKRTATYEKGLVFEETITKYESEKQLILDIDADPTKIPPTVMDEHIVIGGKHLDILEDVYTLTSLPDGKTQITLSSRFFINTPFNWYAGIWARYLMKDILKNELNIIEKRAINE